MGELRGTIMENHRFDELPPSQQKLVKELTNTMASNGHLPSATKDRIVAAAISELVDAGREALTDTDV